MQTRLFAIFVSSRHIQIRVSLYLNRVNSAEMKNKLFMQLLLVVFVKDGGSERHNNGSLLLQPLQSGVHDWLHLRRPASVGSSHEPAPRREERPRPGRLLLHLRPRHPQWWETLRCINQLFSGIRCFQQQKSKWKNYAARLSKCNCSKSKWCSVVCLAATGLCAYLLVLWHALNETTDDVLGDLHHCKGSDPLFHGHNPHYLSWIQRILQSVSFPAPWSKLSQGGWAVWIMHLLN